MRAQQIELSIEVETREQPADLQKEALKDVIKTQSLKLNTAPKSQQKGNSDSPLFRPQNQTELF